MIVTALLVAVCGGAASGSGLSTPEQVRADSGQDSIADYSSVPELTAEYVVLDADSDTVLEQFRVQLSPHGLRTTETWQGLQRVNVQNFETDQAWIIDPQRKVAHELAVILLPDPVDADEPGGLPRDVEESVESDVDSDSINPLSGHGPEWPAERAMVLGEIPVGVMMIDTCAGLRGVNLGRKQWRGHSVQQWRCRLPDGQLWSTQYFSDHWGIVVREVGQDRIAYELRSIQRAQFPTAYFQPDPNFRAVTLSELISEAALLPTYRP